MISSFESLVGGSASDIISIVAIIISIIGFLYTRTRNRVQAFNAIVEMEQSINLSSCMDVVRKTGRAYQEKYQERLFEVDRATELYRRITQDEKDAAEKIRRAVDFFNSLAHLGRLKYFGNDEVLRLYHLSLQDCRQYLEWWLIGFRAEHGRDSYYVNYENLIEAAVTYKTPTQYRHLGEKNTSKENLVKLVLAHGELELLDNTPINTVCFRYMVPGIDSERLNTFNKALMLRLRKSRVRVPGYMVLRGKHVIRVAFTNQRRREDFNLLVETVVKIGNLMRDEMGVKA